MELLSTVVAFIVVLVILVLVHEVGHFAVAKLAGITVQEFGVGFPPRIASLRWRGTRYSLNWIPLGGFVKMLGEDGESELDRLRRQGLTETEIERMAAGAFNRKPIPVRLAVLLAGVAMNFLLAVALFSVVAGLPQPRYLAPLTVTEVQADSPAVAAGLQERDRIVAVDGHRYTVATELTGYLREQAEQQIELTVLRDGEERTLTVTPRALTDEQRAAGLGAVGFSWEPAGIEDGPSIAGGPLEALAWGTATSAQIAVQIPGALADAVAGLLGLAPNTGTARGPIGIAEETGRVLGSPLISQLSFVGLLSVNLAVLNVLPFPPLDGGRIVVTLLEGLRRRRLPAQSEALIYLTGFLVLIFLIILISIQDVARIFGG